MKKLVLAAALAGIMLLSGCSGVSQDEYNSLLEENSKLKESSSSSESASSETSTSEASTSSSTESSNTTESDISSESNDDNFTHSIKNKFVSKIEDMEKFVDGFYISSSSALDKYNLVDTSGEISLGYEEIYTGKFLNSGEYVTNMYLVYYLDDDKINCSLIYNAMDMINKYLDYVDGSELYTLYVDNSKNEHVVTITNIYGGAITAPHISWYTSEAREKYGEIENTTYFKDFKVKVLYE